MGKKAKRKDLRVYIRRSFFIKNRLLFPSLDSLKVRDFIYKFFTCIVFFYILLNGKFSASSLRYLRKARFLPFFRFFLLYTFAFSNKANPYCLSGCFASLRFSRELYLLYRRKSFTIQLSYLAIGLYHLFYFASL